MKAKRNFEINPRHPLIIELNRRVTEDSDDAQALDMLTSLYMSSVLQAGYQLAPEDVSEFAQRVTNVVTSGLGVDPNAELAPEVEVPDEPEEQEEEEVESFDEEDGGKDEV